MQVRASGEGDKKKKKKKKLRIKKTDGDVDGETDHAERAATFSLESHQDQRDSDEADTSKKNRGEPDAMAVSTGNGKVTLWQRKTPKGHVEPDLDRSQQSASFDTGASFDVGAQQEQLKE